MDKIHIHNLEVYCNHGVYKEENVLGQKFLVSAILYTDTRKAGRSDDLKQSIHYGEACQMIDRYMRSHTFQLIERVAEQLAMELLRNIPGLRKIRLEVKKPWAPIGLPLETVSVEIERQWHIAYIALGSNMGDRRQYLETAVGRLREDQYCEVERVSEYINTAPYGVTEQADFLNGCLKLRTLLSAEELLELLQQIEQDAGRERLVRWGPRTLDLDIIFYDDDVIDTEALTVPHAEMHKRLFVLGPLQEIAPRMRHPLLKKTVTELYQKLATGEEL